MGMSNDPLFASDPLGGNAAGGGNNSGKGGVIIKPEDTLSITFIGPEGVVMPPFEGRVSEEGYVTLQLIPPIKAAGKTATELQKDINDAYVPKYYLRLTVTVRAADRFYYVGGEVKAPNRYLWAGEITLTKAIQTASDFTDWAQKKKVIITRGDGKRIGPINCVKVLEGKIPDVPVYPGDKIYVPRRGF
jgi:protein involved in polysaccharide export with SLBB domain